MNNAERSVARKGVSLLLLVFTLGIILGSLVGCRSPQQRDVDLVLKLGLHRLGAIVAGG